MLSDSDRKIILDVYNDPTQGISLNKTYNRLKSKYTLSQIKEALGTQESVQTSKKTNLKSRFFKITTDETSQYQADLMFLDAKYKKFNGGMNFFSLSYMSCHVIFMYIL